MTIPEVTILVMMMKMSSSKIEMGLGLAMAGMAVVRRWKGVMMEDLRKN